MKEINLNNITDVRSGIICLRSVIGQHGPEHPLVNSTITQIDKHLRAQERATQKMTAGAEDVSSFYNLALLTRDALQGEVTLERIHHFDDGMTCVRTLLEKYGHQDIRVTEAIEKIDAHLRKLQKNTQVIWVTKSETHTLDFKEVAEFSVRVHEIRERYGMTRKNPLERGNTNPPGTAQAR